MFTSREQEENVYTHSGTGERKIVQMHKGMVYLY